MYKMVMVDDEGYVLDGLRRFIDWPALEIEVVATASNGLEGLAAVLEHRPQILLTDIRMPKMDGIDLIKYLYEHHLGVKVVTLSGYEEFDLVKQCMQYGVLDYILKPSVPSEIRATMQKVVALCREEEQREREQQSLRDELRRSTRQRSDAFLSDVMQGVYADSALMARRAEEFGLSEVLSHCFAVWVHMRDYAGYRTHAPEQRAFIRHNLSYILQDVFGCEGLLLGFKGGVAAFLADLRRPEVAADPRAWVAQGVRRAQEKVHKGFGMGLRFGVGGPASALWEVYDSCNQAREAVRQMLGMPPETELVFYADIAGRLQAPRFQKFFEREALARALRTKDLAGINRCLESAFARFAGEGFLPYGDVERNLTDLLGMVYENLGYGSGDGARPELELPAPSELLEGVEDLPQLQGRLAALFAKLAESFSSANRRNTRRWSPKSSPISSKTMPASPPWAISPKRSISPPTISATFSPAMWARASLPTSSATGSSGPRPCWRRGSIKSTR